MRLIAYFKTMLKRKSLAEAKRIDAEYPVESTMFDVVLVVSLIALCLYLGIKMGMWLS